MSGTTAVQLFLGLALVVWAAGCDGDTGSGERWEGDPQLLHGAWRAAERSAEGWSHLWFEPNGVYHEILTLDHTAAEVERGTFRVTAGVLYRTVTRHRAPDREGSATTNGIYRLDAYDLVLDPATPAPLRLFYERVSELPTFARLP